MSSQEVKKRRGRPPGSKNKRKQNPEKPPVQKPIRTPVEAPVETCPQLTKALDTILGMTKENESEEVEGEVFKDPITEQKKSTQWINEATKAKKSLIMSLPGLKKLREVINLTIIMTEQAKDLHDFMDTLNGSVNGAVGLIMCDDKHGWMDLSFCKYTCNDKCYKYNMGRWICTLLRCNNEKLTLCDERNAHCQAFDIIMGFADRYTTEKYRAEGEAKKI